MTALAEDRPDKSEFDFSSTQAVLTGSCTDCHGDGESEGGFSIGKLAEPSSLVEQSEMWTKARRRIIERTMPPDDAEPLEDAQRDSISQWIDQAIVEAICKEGPQPGPPMVRRLARHEYANSMRDLLEVHFNAAEGLPEDGAGGEGFTNAAETLIVSPDHAERYLVAANRCLEYAASNATSREILFVHLPGEKVSESESAVANLRRLAERAYRRPVAQSEIDRLLKLFTVARADEMTYEESLLYAMRAILISPEFLFITETPPEKSGERTPLPPHELATRLSYFLWATTPDDELREAADNASLATIDELRNQTRRMLGDESTHLRDSMDSFVGQWLGTADLGAAKKIDIQAHDWVEEPHVASMRNQPVYAFEKILRENRSLFKLIDAPWVHMNRFLMEVYEMDRSEFKSEFVGNLVEVELPEKYQYRGGLLAMAGVHSVSSYPRRSSPVLRGSWVLDKMLGVELPPPPADVPGLEDSQEAKVARTLRARLEQHRADATCASCHNRIDPIGFALENFDEVGRWREKDEGGPIDSVALLPDGRKLDGLQGLKTYMMERKDDFAGQLTRKMLGYALGRGLLPSDRCTVESIVVRLKENDYNSHELILGIVESEPFRMKR